MSDDGPRAAAVGVAAAGIGAASGGAANPGPQSFAEPTVHSYHHRLAEMEYSEFDYCGPDSSVPTFVVVHGIGMGRRAMEPLAGELQRAGNVYALDLPGFGDSPEPRHNGTMAAMGELVAHFIDDLALKKVILVGHSMGTQVATETAIAHPADCVGLVLIAPTINRYERSAWQQTRRLLQDLAGEKPQVLAAGLETYVRAGPWWFLGKVRRMLEHDVEHRYPLIRVPTLVLRGSQDRVVPRRWALEVAAAIPGAQYNEIRGHRHEAMVHRPQQAAREIRQFASAVM
ncbi:alpha/beta fold hydrolase [Rarobacter incanus]|uniref:alpha/beta fold hydrolase n=1 Tax=Rarobacter incanus TaxID=153494 RepID=UPI001477670B|nr:alpha/beta hydrolase [Rarobacter incanus]